MVVEESINIFTTADAKGAGKRGSKEEDWFFYWPKLPRKYSILLPSPSIFGDY